MHNSHVLILHTCQSLVYHQHHQQVGVGVLSCIAVPTQAAEQSVGRLGLVLQLFSTTLGHMSSINQICLFIIVSLACCPHLSCAHVYPCCAATCALAQAVCILPCCLVCPARLCIDCVAGIQHGTQP